MSIELLNDAYQNKVYNILVVSYETKIINKLAILFEPSKYSFTLVRDPLLALEKIKNENFDIVLINFSFSKTLVEQFIKKIRFFDSFLYIVLVTNNNDLSNTLNIIKTCDIEGYFNSNENFEKLVILIELIANSIYEFMRINLQLDNFSENYKSPYLSTVQILRNIVEYKDRYTIGHSFRVSKYAVLIGRKLKLSKEELNILKIGSMFHDIGKISVPNSILLKSEKLTDKEYYQIKQHPLTGAHILYPTTLYKKMIPIVKFHHERFDGTGYPARLKGVDIPLLVRIVTIADTFDAMTSKRTYRNSLPIETVIKEFENNKGSQFDPDITEVFLDILKNDYLKIQKIQKRYK